MESMPDKAADSPSGTSRESHSNRVRTYEWRDLEQTVVDNQVKWTVYLPSKDIADCSSGGGDEMEIPNTMLSKDVADFGSGDAIAMEISNSPTSTLTADTDINNVSIMMSDHDLDQTFQSSALAFGLKEASGDLLDDIPGPSDGPYPAFDLQELRSSSILPMISPDFEASTEDCNSCGSDASGNQWSAVGDLATFDGMVFQDSSKNSGPEQETCEMFKGPACEIFESLESLHTVPGEESNCHLPSLQDVEIEQQQISMVSNYSFKRNVEEIRDKDCGVELVHELWACAEAVARGEMVAAQQHVEQLTHLMSPNGSTMERVASYFTEALRSRIWNTGDFKRGYHDQGSACAYSSSPPVPLQHTWFAYQAFYRACPYLIVTHFAANQAILEAFEGEEKVHIVDLDIKLGLQWPSLIQALSERPRGPPQLRISVVAGSTPDHLDSVATRNRLLEFADMYNVPLEYNVIEEDVESLQPWSLQIRQDEALAVNCVTSLHQLIHRPRRSIDSFLSMVRSLGPSVVTIVEEDANHDQEFFPRFQDALQYYSSMFDSIAASCLSTSLAEREMVERLLLGKDIMNIVGREGQERSARHQPAELWIQRMTGVGFRLLPPTNINNFQAECLLNKYPVFKNCLIDQESYLSLGWHGKPLYSVSSWR